MDPKTAQENLAFIRNIIADSRRMAVDIGLDYIVWGLLVSAGMFATVALEMLKMQGHVYLWLWIAVMGCGWAFSLARQLKKKSTQAVHTLSGSILKSLWLSCGIVIMLFIFVGGPLLRQSLTPAIAAVLGIGYLVSGRLLDFTYFKISAIAFWVGSAAMFYLKSQSGQALFTGIHADILLFAVMLVLFQTLPGIILYRRWRRGQGETSRA